MSNNIEQMEALERAVKEILLFMWKGLKREADEASEEQPLGGFYLARYRRFFPVWYDRYYARPILVNI